MPYTYIICANVSDNLREWNDVKGNLAAFHFYSFSLNTPFISCMGLLSKKHLQTWLVHAFSWMCKTWMVSVDSYYILFACDSLHIIMQTVITRARNRNSCKHAFKINKLKCNIQHWAEPYKEIYQNSSYHTQHIFWISSALYLRWNIYF